MKRLATALLLVPLALVAIFGPVWVMYTVTAVVAVLCFHEFSGIASAGGVDGLAPFGYIAGLALLFADRQIPLVVTGIALLALTMPLAGASLRETLPRASVLLFGVVYVFGTWKFAFLLREVSPYWLLFALFINWAGDAAAYYAGRAFGKHKLAPVISPKKTWEGSVASMLASVVLGTAYIAYFLPATPVWFTVAVAAAGNVAGQVGDLAESAIKRGAGVKDSGTVLPGHGGMLDRVDSTLFALPVVYLSVILPR